MRINPSRHIGFWNQKKDDVYDVHRVMRIIDDLILNAPDIPNSYRFMTSTGILNKSKCMNLLGFLEEKTDPRSSRIKILLKRLLRHGEK